MALAFSLNIAPAWAAPGDAVGLQSGVSTINDQAFSDFSGRLGVNVAAGVANTQLNAAAIADQANVFFSTTAVNPPGSEATRPGTTSFYTAIDGNTFRNASGLIGINQVSGQTNRQANVAALGGSSAQVTIVGDAALAQVVPAPGGIETLPPGHFVRREAQVASTAFNGASGLVQLNQTAGVSNFSANLFTLRNMPGG